MVESRQVDRGSINIQEQKAAHSNAKQLDLEHDGAENVARVECCKADAVYGNLLVKPYALDARHRADQVTVRVENVVGRRAHLRHLHVVS